MTALARIAIPEAPHGLMTADRLEWHLENWSAWMRRRSIPGGFPSRASGRMGSSGTRDFDSMVECEDVKCAVAIDAIIDSLERTFREAVYAVWLGGHIRQSLRVGIVYDSAVAEIRQLAKRRRLD